MTTKDSAPATLPSPLPWTLVNDSAYAINIVAANKLIVGSAVGGHDQMPFGSEPTMHVNAALIVHCVNSYEQIVAALKECSRLLHDRALDEDALAVLVTCDAALAVQEKRR